MDKGALPGDLVAEMTRWRQHLHAHPEFGFEEHGTARFVADRLRGFGIEDVVEGVGGTGVVATIHRAVPGVVGTGGSIALRADMDALRIEERTGLEYASRRPGLMHACGHDGHTTILLGTARDLMERGGFNGTVHLVFQPAEEWGRGMAAMLDDGLLERFPFDEVYALHNRPGLPIGQFETRPGPFMAAEDNFEVMITGSGGHASRPQECRDALLAACATVVSLQSVVARFIDPSELAVLSTTGIKTDGTRNVIAGRARLEGDCRSFSPEVSALIEQSLRGIATSTALAHGCSAEVGYDRVFVPLVNDPTATARALAVARRVFGEAAVNGDANRIGASEDFARLLLHVPGNFANLGNGPSAVCHSPLFDFEDAALPYGVRYFTALVRDRLTAD